MGIELEDLRMLQSAESVADEIWKIVAGWDNFTRDIVGGQLARAVDSIGANIAESFGRFHYGEKLSSCIMLAAVCLRQNTGSTVPRSKISSLRNKHTSMRKTLQLSLANSTHLPVVSKASESIYPKKRLRKRQQIMKSTNL